MANPPITKIDFSTGKAVVYADTQTFTFPIKPAGSVPAVGVPPIVPPPVVAPPVVVAPSVAELADMKVTPSKALVLGTAVMLKTRHYDAADCPLTIQGAGMRKTILDGQGGAGGGHRLAFGKAFIHAAGPVTIRDVGFRRCGGADSVSDGETSLYVESLTAAGTALYHRCAFDGCENGVFSPAPPSGANLAVVIDACVFGGEAPNGAADGGSHDIYSNAESLTVRRSVFVGNSLGNTIKSRSATVLLEENFIGRSGGRWLDMPCATNLTSRANTYVSYNRSVTANALGLFDENDLKFPGGGTFNFTDDTFYFGRQNGEVIWLPDARTVATFTRCKVFWVGKAGDKPKPVEVRGPGKLTGLDLAFTEANRVAAAPDVPGDPVAA